MQDILDGKFWEKGCRELRVKGAQLCASQYNTVSHPTSEYLDYHPALFWQAALDFQCTAR